MRWALVLGLLGLMAQAALGEGRYTPAPQIDETQVRADCSYDAFYYCGVPVANYIADPSGMNRQAILACMKQNRSSLQDKCARHLH